LNYHIDSKHLLLFKQHNQPPQFTIQVEYLIEASTIDKCPSQMRLIFYTENKKLIRCQKEWRIKFENVIKRERFYRLLREAMPTKENSAKFVYTPQPLMIRKKAKAQIKELPVRKLAGALHDAWNEGKQQLGWEYGSVYNEATKTDPEMCDWEKLSEANGKYDLDIAELTLAAMHELGYDIRLRRGSESGGQEQVSQLIDFLAENAHESWASNKMAQGWKSGNLKDSNAKTHPLLKPYVDLRECDKQADIEAANTIIAQLHTLGYGMCKRDGISFNSDIS